MAWLCKCLCVCVCARAAGVASGGCRSSKQASDSKIGLHRAGGHEELHMKVTFLGGQAWLRLLQPRRDPIDSFPGRVGRAYVQSTYCDHSLGTSALKPQA